jgi:hypothetical protein
MHGVTMKFYSGFYPQPDECSMVTQAIYLIFSSHSNKCLLTVLLYKIFILLSQINFSVVCISKDVHTDVMLKCEGHSENKFPWLLISLTKNIHTSISGP